jgi:hypothetical protein
MTDYVTRSKHLGLASPAPRKPWIALAVLGALLACAPGARASSIYIGLQEAGVNSGAITQEATGPGTASISNVLYGDTADGSFQLSVTATGTPPLPDPFLNSTSLDVTGSHPGMIAIYVTELNQVPAAFSDF